MKGVWLPHAGSYENGLIAVTEQVINTDGAADMCIRTEFNAF